MSGESPGPHPLTHIYFDGTGIAGYSLKTPNRFLYENMVCVIGLALPYRKSFC